MSLEYELRLPDVPRDGAPLIVLLHGRGSDRFDLLGLRAGLPAEAVIVAPQAPFPGAPWGYGQGWAWYRFLGEDRPEPESFEESQAALADFLASLPATLPVVPGALTLGGFSQGGTMSLAYALRNPGSVQNVLNFSGFLANHPSVVPNPEALRGTRIFWGHGTLDPAIPFALAERGRAVLRRAGADLETHDYSIGHWIEPEEVRDARDWIERASADFDPPPPGGRG